MIYYAMDASVYKNAEEANAAGVTLTLKRACLASPTPKGCAIFNDSKVAVVSASVEILNVQINGFGNCTMSAPIIVTTSDNATSAQSTLDGCVSSFSGTITSLKVETSHQLNPDASSSCAPLQTYLI